MGFKDIGCGPDYEQTGRLTESFPSTQHRVLQHRIKQQFLRYTGSLPSTAKLEPSTLVGHAHVGQRGAELIDLPGSHIQRERMSRNSFRRLSNQRGLPRSSSCQVARQRIVLDKQTEHSRRSQRRTNATACARLL